MPLGLAMGALAIGKGLIKKHAGKAVKKAAGKAWETAKKVIRHPATKTAGGAVGAGAGFEIGGRVARRREVATGGLDEQVAELYFAYFGQEATDAVLAEWGARGHAGNRGIAFVEQEFARISGNPTPKYQRDSGGHAGFHGGYSDMSIGGIPLIVQPEVVSALRAPKGYSIVTDPMSGEKVAMLTKAAVALGLRKSSRRGGGITAREVSAARKVQSFVTKLTVARKPRVAIKKRGR